MPRHPPDGGAYGEEHEGNANPLQFEAPGVPIPKRDLPSSEPSAPFRGAPDDERPLPRRRIIMAEPSREEIDAKLEAAEARTEARFAQLTGTLDLRFSNLDHKVDRIADSVGFVSAKMIETADRLSAQLIETQREVRAENKTTRSTMIVTAIVSVITVIGILLTVLLASQSNLLSAFQAGLAVKTFQSQPSKP